MPPPPRACVHGWLLRHDALRPLQRAAPGASPRGRARRRCCQRRRDHGQQGPAGHAAPREAIVALKKGAHLLKCGKRGKPKFCPFRLSSDEKTLVWYSKDREKQLSLNSVSTVVLGQKTINFLRQHWPEKESQSLSLIYKNGECSVDLVFPLLDLKPITFVNCNIVNVKFSLLVSHLLKIKLTQICRDRDQAECWYLGLIALISAPYSPFSLVGSKSSRQINNCTNSPHGYIQRKSRLSAVHDTPRYTQVFSDAIEALRVSYRKMNPFCVPFATTNMGSAILAMDLGWMGPNYSISTVCATSNFCILNAANHIIRGETDVMLCGGSDAPLIPIGLGGFVACRALSQRNSDPTKASRPWDVDRDGFVMGEGASVLLLEELEHAKVLEEQH